MDRPLQRPGAIDWIVARIAEPFLRRTIQFKYDLAVVEQPLQPQQLDIYDPGHVGAGQTMEQQDLVDPVEEFWTERGLHHLHHRFAHGAGILAFRLVGQNLGAQIGGQHDDDVGEVDRTALPVGKPAVVEDLQQ